MAMQHGNNQTNNMSQICNPLLPTCLECKGCIALPRLILAVTVAGDFLCDVTTMCFFVYITGPLLPDSAWPCLIFTLAICFRAVGSTKWGKEYRKKYTYCKLNAQIRSLTHAPSLRIYGYEQGMTQVSAPNFYCSRRKLWRHKCVKICPCFYCEQAFINILTSWMSKGSCSRNVFSSAGNKSYISLSAAHPTFHI